MWNIVTTTPASFDPVSASDMHTFLRLNDTSEDALLTGFVETAADLWTVSTGMVLGASTLMLRLDHWPTRLVDAWGNPTPYPYPYNLGINSQWPSTVIYVPRQPVTAITSVQYLDQTGTWQTLDPTTYTTDLLSVPARVNLPQSLPILHPYIRPAVQVTFTAGYSSAGAIPASVLVGIKLLASHYYANREAYTDGELSNLPQGWLALTKRWDTGVLGDWNK